MQLCAGRHLQARMRIGYTPGFIIGTERSGCGITDRNLVTGRSAVDPIAQLIDITDVPAR